jgi:hypothetical protein
VEDSNLGEERSVRQDMIIGREKEGKGYGRATETPIMQS